MVKKINLTIDDKKVSVPRGTTILKAAGISGINIPTLCYLEGINDIGACKVCVVELENVNRLVSSCNTVCEDGMVVKTNTPKVMEARRDAVELILSQHDCHCATCVRCGNCKLQDLATNLNILDIRYEKNVKDSAWTDDFAIVRDASKCIKCMRCVQICDKVQSLKIWDLIGTGTWTDVGVAGGKKIEESDCSACGQCITHCPVGALREKDDTKRVFEALKNPDKVTVIQVAPAVRTAWAQYFGLDPKFATPKRMVAAIKKLGFDYVFDTNFAADLTIMEEGSELIKRLSHPKKYNWPMFTSCCPGWVRFIKSQYPDMVDNLSTAKSPQQMFGAVAKSYFAEKIGVDPRNICCISVMPCTAKKEELKLPGMNSACGDKDVDISITTRELIRILRTDNVNFETLNEQNFDSVLGESSGAAVIFGATGGVMEAALRSAYYLVTGENPKADAFKSVRGMDGWKDATFDIAGTKLKVAVVSGLGNARKLLDAIRNKELEYDFVEVMACPGGCAGGGGQPIVIDTELAGERGKILYNLDSKAKIRFSHENPSVQTLYKEYLVEPLGKQSHKLLHVDHKE